LDGIAAGEARRSAVELTQWVELHTGVGTWVNDDGTAESEESAVATLFTTAADAHLNAGLLHDFAAEFAAEFDQDAVAVVVRGASALVDAAGRVRR
jgi:hypothetical protein